jgi:transposase
MKGRDAPTIAHDLGRSRRAVQQWVRWYNQEGLGALRDAPRSGQPKKLTLAQEAQLCAWLDAGLEPDAGESARRGPEVHRHLQREFGVKYSLAGAYAVLHRLGYSALMPRPRHRQADAAARAQFTTNAPLLSRGSGGTTRARSSKSGTRTRPASGSRAR